VLPSSGTRWVFGLFPFLFILSILELHLYPSFFLRSV
jgi:hypothetical protein